MGEGIEKGKQYQAVFETSKGRIVMELDADEVPGTVNSFVYLIRHHYYDGIVFHRVLDNFMAQTGDPTGTGSGGPGYDFADERTSKRHDQPGVLSMANRGPDTNGSQIFMTFVPTAAPRRTPHGLRARGGGHGRAEQHHAHQPAAPARPTASSGPTWWKNKSVACGL